MLLFCFFFFQAEDGIRYLTVTGVQTCALPLPQFRTLVFLLGREPEAASDALTAGDVALLDEWVRRGGVVVLGYDGDGEGYLDRWTANRWLAYEGAGISIGDRVLEDTTLRVVTTGRMQPWVVAQPVGDEPLGSAYDQIGRAHV